MFTGRRRALARAAAAVTLLLTGCASLAAAPDPPAGTAAGVHWPIPDDAHRGRVERVVDGDTIHVEGLGSSRLIGIDTPEVYGHDECYGEQASAFTKRLLPEGAIVTYRLGRDPEDRYGRDLIDVWLPDGRSVNALLVANGYARSLTIAPNTTYARPLAQLERHARRHQRGLWGACRR